MIKTTLEKFSIKWGNMDKEATLTLLVNLMYTENGLGDLVPLGINSGEFLPDMSTSRKKVFQAIPLTEETYKAMVLARSGDEELNHLWALKDDRSGNMDIEGLRGSRPCDFSFGDTEFSKVEVEMVKFGKKRLPILKLEFCCNCSPELASWLYNNLQRDVGLHLNSYEEAQPPLKIKGNDNV